MQIAKEILEITEVTVVGTRTLKVNFNDGTEGEVRLNELLSSPPPVFHALQDEKEFMKVSINPVGGVIWDCGADLSADYLKSALHQEMTDGSRAS